MSVVEFTLKDPKWEGLGYSKSPRNRSMSIPSSLDFFQSSMSTRRNSSPSLLRQMVARQIQKTGHLLSSISVKDWLGFDSKWLPIPLVQESDNLASIVESLSSTHKSIAIVQDSQGKIIGSIDIMDLVSVCYERVKGSSDFEFGAISCRDSFLVENGKSFLDLGYGSRVFSISGNATLLDLIKLLSNPQITRVIVMKEGKEEVEHYEDVVAIVSQSEIIRYALENPQLFYLKSPASECIPNAQVLLDAAIEAEETKVKDHFRVSASFKAIWDKQNLGGVFCHGTSFLDKFLNWMVHIMSAELPLEDVSVECGTTLQEIMKLVYNKGVPEILVSNEQGETLGFIEVHGIMSKILDLAEGGSKRSL